MQVAIAWFRLLDSQVPWLFFMLLGDANVALPMRTYNSRCMQAFADATYFSPMLLSLSAHSFSDVP